MQFKYNNIIKDILQNCGRTILLRNDESHVKLITNVYSNYNWLPWKFNQAPKGYWNDENNVKQYMNWLSDKLNIKKMEDWYNISQKVS